LEELIFERPEAFPVYKRADTVTRFEPSETFKEVKVPTVVIFVCVFASWDARMRPFRFDVVKFERAEAFPMYRLLVRTSTSAPPATVNEYPGLEDVCIPTLPSGSMTIAKV
jgi:hypothetical protein